MKKWMKIVFWILAAVVVVVIALMAFGRLVIYPGEVRKECDAKAREAASEQRSLSGAEATYKLLYDSCFRQKGLKPEE